MRSTSDSVCRKSMRLAAAVVLGSLPIHAQQLAPDDAALLVLNAGRRAFNEQKYPFAADKFREFLTASPNHKEAAAAKYALGLALLETGDAKALETLQQASASDFPERALAHYHIGVVQRAAGVQSLAQIAAKPNEEQSLRALAAQKFTEAAKSFQTAVELLTARVIKPSGEAQTELSAEAEWLVRARCDLAEMSIRLNKPKEAVDLAWSVLVDPAWARSRSLALASYHMGYASFLLKDYVAAGKALSELAPFTQEFGLHARYLLARTHHAAGELAEAAIQYKAVLAGYEERKKAAQETLKNPAALKAEQKAALEALVNQAPPEHVSRAVFYNAVLAFDEGRQTEAMEQFTVFAQKNPKSPLAAEAQFRVGACLVQLKKFPEAIAALDPLKEHPQLADQALTWLARARIGGADPAKLAEYEQALNAALDSLRRASQRAAELAKTDADAKVRRLNILMELADAAVMAKQFKEAVSNYEAIIAEKGERSEEALQRAVTAQHLAGQYPEADALAARFEGVFPKSTLLPAVIFRSAEGAYLGALKLTDLNAQKQQLGEAVKRYQRVIRKFPEFPLINLARQGMATAHYRMGNYTEAALVFATIAEPDRVGDLANVPYLLADCLIRGLPPEADDALQAARLIEKAEQAAKLLEGFVTSNEKSPQAPDALLKLGHCYQRVGVLMVAPAERTKLLTSARDAYDRAQKLFDKEPIQSVALFERAKCMALLGDANGAAAALAQFQNGPLNATPNAPLALLRLSVLMRSQGKAVDAVNILTQCRAQHEGRLQADPARANWAAMIQYEQALALKESGKHAEAKAQFDTLSKTFAGKPEGLNALWRTIQCRRDEALAQISTARTAAAKQGAKAEEIAAAGKVIETGTDALRDAAESFQVQAEQLANTATGSEPHLRMLYEAAWCHRLLAEGESEPARQTAAAEPAKKAEALAQPASERHAIDSYLKLIAAGPDSPLATQARCELGEMHAARGESDRVAELLSDALEKDTAAEFTERIRLGLAAAHLARKNPKSAFAAVQPVLENTASPAIAEARAIAGEALIQQQLWPKAIEQLLPFRDDEKLRNITGVSDRALLRLGHAYAQAAQWDACRQTLDALAQRYPQSPWLAEARYGTGWAWQNQKNYDQAVAAFTEVTKRTTAEVAAKAQLQIGVCRLEQKRYEEAVNALLTVAFTYNYPDLTAPARCEAARAHIEMKKPQEASRQWQQVVNDYPKSPWAGVARKGLAEIKQP